MVDTRLATVVIFGLLVGTGFTKKCGRKESIIQPLMFNAYKAGHGAWPWHGAMFHRNEASESYVCGVTILKERVVITAAHCTFDPHNNWLEMPAGRIRLKFGLINLARPGKHAQIIDANSIIRHKDYDYNTLEDDIALIKLRTAITYTSFVLPICLWQGDSSLDKIISRVGYITGWGQDEHGYPDDLKEATAPIVSKRECTASFPEHYLRVYHEPKTFCAGYRNGTSAGTGDSGGGMFLHTENTWFLRGIVSNGRRDPNSLKIDPKSFVVFTDVAHYLNWIQQHITIRNEIVAPPPSSVTTRQPNLLGIETCGKDTNPVGTPEELKVLINQYPWLVVIEFYNSKTQTVKDVCHGVLIHPEFVLTTAHCTKDKKDSKLRSIRLNDYLLDTEVDVLESNGKQIRTNFERIDIVGKSTHPSHNSPKYSNNIALLMLKTSTNRTPICLSTKGSTLPLNVPFSIIGWKINSHREKSMVRNVVQIADFEKCKNMYLTENIALDTSGGQICSTYNHDDDDENCSHYMGSAPFQYVLNDASGGRYFLAGISSFGHENCRRDDFSDVFTNVAHYAEWIHGKITKVMQRRM